MRSIKKTISTRVAWPLISRVKAWKQRARLRSAHRRAMPDFIIPGAQKAGTSSLFAYLSQHPEVVPPVTKEAHYFDLKYDRGEAWYRSYFPLVESLKDGALITGEASPYYLFHPHCPERIRETVPAVKLIVLLRNPIDRAISHYFHEVRLKFESLSMEEAFAAEEERIGPDIEKMEEDPTYAGFAHQHFSYKKRGIYADQIERYRALFPPEQMLILKAEDLFADPETVTRAVYAYLEIDPDRAPRNARPRNVGSYEGRVSAPVYDSLAAYFAPHNERLYALLQRDFGW